MLLGMQAELHDTLRLFFAKSLYPSHLRNEGWVRVRREIACVRLLTLHLRLRARAAGKRFGSRSDGVVDLFNQCVEEIPEQIRSRARQMWRDVDGSSSTDRLSAN